MEEFLTNYWWLLLLSMLWTLVWTGLALWKSARNNQKWWFVALLLINTLGFLEILYIFIFGKEKKVNQEGEKFKEHPGT